MSDHIAIPQPNGRGQQRFSRHRISTTPPRTQEQTFPEEEFIDDDSEEEYLNDSTVQLMFNKIYVDPLQEVFEALDGEAGNILRTGKFSVAGETGSMDLLQPLIFSLQATEEQLTLILPQLMQNPFFNPSQRIQEMFAFSVEPKLILSGGLIRLGVKVDTVIYELLSSFSTKGPGSKQADALINTALKTTYSLPSSAETFRFRCQNGPPLVANGYIMTPSQFPMEDISDGGSDCSDEAVDGSPSPQAATKRNTSVSSDGTSGIGGSLKDRESITEFYPGNQDGAVPIKRSLSNSMRERSGSGRKDSVAMFPWNKTVVVPSSSSRKHSDISEVSTTSILSDNHWQVSIESPANDMIVGCYSDSSYSILMWNPKFKVEFELGSEEDGMCTTTYCVSPSKPSVSLHIVNPTSETIAFSIRAYRQSLMFRSHVIYPQDGLKDLEAHDEFWQDFDVVGSEGIKRDEHIIIDLLVCKLHGEPSWNIQRRHVILKYTDEQHKDLHLSSEQRLLNKLFDNGYPLQPGIHKDLSATLKQVMLHGLQCVVKNKIEEAEIIFTQALHLPLFQRVPLKAFAYICLAVISDKKRKKFNVNRVNHIFKLVMRLDELLDACESGGAPQLQMPKMIALIKQLKKELNLTKILETFRNKSETFKPKRRDVTATITHEGDSIALDETNLTVPSGALSQDTKLTLSNLNKTEIHDTLQTSQWASILNVVAAFNITCSPPVDRFEAPVTASITLPSDMQMPRPPFRLLQSKYMNNWIDITDDPASGVAIDEKTLTVQTDHTGWILVATLSMDVSQILQIAVKSLFAEEPVTLEVNVFGRSVPDGSHEVTAFVTPTTKNDSLLNQKKDPPSSEHRRISFPHSFKAYRGQKLRLELQGNFAEQNTIGLEHICIVDSNVEAIMTKDIRLLSAKPSAERIVISKFCNVHSKWEYVQDIKLTSLHEL